MDLSAVPTWVTGPVMAIVFPLAVEGGFRLHLLSSRNRRGDGAGGAGYIVSATLALLGLLTGFTFAMSANATTPAAIWWWRKPTPSPTSGCASRCSKSPSAAI